LVDVLVVGAGAAGIAAAHTLRQRGLAVIVLEARDRIGGRVWTSAAWPALPVDMGAGWIHGYARNPLTALARAVNATLYPSDTIFLGGRLALYHTDGRRLTEAERADLEARFDATLREIETLSRARQSRGLPDISLQAGLEHVRAARGFSAQAMRELNYKFNSEMEHEYSGDIGHLSLYHWDDDQTPMVMGEHDALPGGGYVRLFEPLARDLDVRLEHVVERIAYDDAGVSVTTQRGVFTAQRAIVTLPLGVLKAGTVAFSPELPERKLAAIRALDMGVLNKIVLRFSFRFWPAEAEWLGYISEEKGHWAEWFNLGKHVGEPVLVAYNAGHYGREVEQLSDGEMVASALATLRTLFGERAPEPIAWQISRWASDPFARGAYSHLPPGATGDDRDALAEPVANRLFFAGEAASREYSANVHGAWLSGLREAERILAQGT
jgi:monoamine oxidase